VNIVLLMLFASNVRELVRGDDAARPWSTMGLIGLTALAVSFGAVTAAQVALVELAGGGPPRPSRRSGRSTTPPSR
jgi:hypothetical protein